MGWTQYVYYKYPPSVSLLFIRACVYILLCKSFLSAVLSRSLHTTRLITGVGSESWTLMRSDEPLPLKPVVYLVSNT